MSSPVSSAKQQPGLPLSIGQLGMVLLLASISVLFFASCAAVLITFHQATFPGQLALTPATSQLKVPWGVLTSTGVLTAVSGCLHWLQRERKRNRDGQNANLLRIAGALALLFMGLQGSNCAELVSSAGPGARDSLFLFAFNLLIGLHAAHVAGGLVYLFVCLKRLEGKRQSPDVDKALTYCIQYWHYLAVVWVPLVGTLLWVQ